MDTKWKKYKKLDVKCIVVILMIIFMSTSIAFGRELIKNRYLFDIDFYRSGYLNIDVMDIIDTTFRIATGDVEEGYKYKRESIKYFAVDNSNRVFTNTGMKSIEEFKNKFKDYPYYLEIEDNFEKGYKFRYKGEYVEKVTTDFYNFDSVFKNVKKENDSYKDMKMYIAVPKISEIEKSDDAEGWGYKSYFSVVKKPIIINSSVIGISTIGFILLLNKYRKLKNIESKILDRYFKVYNKIFLEIKVISIPIIPILTEYVFRMKTFYSRLEVNILFSIFIFIFLSLILSFIYYLRMNKINIIFKQSIVGRIVNPKQNLNKEKNLVDTWKVRLYTCILLNIILISIICFILVSSSYGTFKNWSSNVTILACIGSVIISVATCIYINSYVGAKFKYIEQIITDTDKIIDGNIEHKIALIEDENLNKLSDNINNLSIGLEKSIEERLKSERMKTELITNVSHDLKTPLTAIINYVSLMKNEDIKPEYIKDYVQVLDKRSQRLKILIEDLFEVSKASSGNLEINLDKTDINQLLTQSLVEMDNFIEDSSLEFIVNLPKEETYIMADGKRMYRVFENLISNIIKYSLEKTRVYIDLEEHDNKVYIIMKNISRQPLNFDSEEITERFTRGDLSRNTEGSGLGLSIVKGFIENQGGEFNIGIIGDLFSVTIIFDLIK